MNIKAMAAVVVIIIVVIAAVGVYLYQEEDDGPSNGEDMYSIIGRVNTEGSGIFLNAGENASEYLQIVTEELVGEEYVFQTDNRWIIFYPENWGGKVFTDPGTGSIQHVQLQQLVEEVMGLNFQLYRAGSTLSSDTVYYVPNVETYAAYVLQVENNHTVGGFIWEAQYSIALQDGCIPLALTNDLFPDHTCCIIGASNQYLSSHSDETVRFLAAYIETVERLQAAKANPTSEDYQTLLRVAIDRVSMPEDMSVEYQEAVIRNALDVVTYIYCDDATAADSLAQLKADIVELAVKFQELGNITTTFEQLGFDSAEDMAESFVKSEYMANAIAGDYSDDYIIASISVAVITGDIHQLALHFGMELGIFADYGLDINIIYQSNGPNVYASLANGTVQFGFIGVPPMTSNSMNNGAIAA